MGLFDKIKLNKKTPQDDTRKFSRTELLEMLIEETKEAERLKAENEKLSAELTRCKEDLDRAASLEVIMNQLESIVNGGTKQEAEEVKAAKAVGLDAEPVPAETPADQDADSVVRAASASLAMRGFRYTTRDPRGEEERARAAANAEPYPPLGVAVPIRLVGFRLAGQKKWEA